MKKIFLVLRLTMALIFIWAFIDKLLGFGFATTPERAWINGGSPTFGFLSNAVRGPFAEFFRSLSGLPAVDWLFMLGLLFVGITLLLNCYVRWGSIAGIVMLLLMYMALLPPENHPFLDDHIVYALVLSIFVFQKTNGNGFDVKNNT